ncbi:MAG: S-formylglutathione hydrolase FrmB [Chlamydiales bacterium]|jgi:S-formylglutathione hydrolase FrmB
MDETPYRRDPLAFTGRVETRPFESRALQGNALGDAHIREVPVYLPPNFEDVEGGLPVVFILSAFTGRPQALLETHPWKAGVVQAFDRAVASGEAPPAILVMPDAFTRLGGSQYVDSSFCGNYETYVARELVAFIDETYPTRPGRRAVCGKSSGGFGALHLGMRHPDTFPVVASISGDCHFEFGYASDFLNAARGLLAHDSDPAAFLAAFAQHCDLSGDGHAVLNLLAMSACYSPNPDSPMGFDLPIDPRSGERIQATWERWLAYDPLHASKHFAANLRRLEWLYLEAGRSDEFHLQFALRALTGRLRELEVPFEHVEFEGGHFGLNARLTALLPELVRRLGRD